MRFRTRTITTLVAALVASLATMAALPVAAQSQPTALAALAAPAGVARVAGTAVVPGGVSMSVPTAGPPTRVSRTCTSAPTGNTETEAASDPARGYAYVVWISCGQMGFSRSADDGRTWSRAIDLPRHEPASYPAWDPAIAVGPSGAVYVTFMTASLKTFAYTPVVDISTDHGKSFQLHRLPGSPGNFGDRPFIAVGPRGQIYVTWDYAPTAKGINENCFPSGSCAYTSGGLNEVVQTSTDGGRTWRRVVPLTPGFPVSGSTAATIVVSPSGRLDAVIERYHLLNKTTLKLGPAHVYFTSSGDGGKTWSAPVRLGLASATISTDTWWIDASVGVDAAGNLYASWDTQKAGTDTGWLAYSTDGGRRWSAPVGVMMTHRATNIVQVLGGAAGRVYVGLLSDSSGGYVQSLREFSIDRGWITSWVPVSRLAGLASVWAGDTIGLALDGGVPGHQRVVVSWGSTYPGRSPQIWATVVRDLP